MKTVELADDQCVHVIDSQWTDHMTIVCVCVYHVYDYIHTHIHTPFLMITVKHLTWK